MVCDCYSYEETRDAQEARRNLNIPPGFNGSKEEPVLEKDESGRFYIQGRRKKTYILDITGEKYGRLTAIKPSYVRSYGESNKVVWLLSCECGNLLETTSNLVVSGKAKSCGCLHSETSAENGRNSRDKIIKEDAALLSLISVYRSGAKKRGLQFELSYDKFKELTSSKCHYCGVAPSKVHTTKHSAYRYNGVDRVNNDEGYTVENSVACCSICNHAKATHSYNVFVNWILDAAENIKQNHILPPEASREFSITDRVVADLKSREKIGFRKYGRYLTEFSDENMLEEVYQELMDASLYMRALLQKEGLRQAIEERNAGK